MERTFYKYLIVGGGIAGVSCAEKVRIKLGVSLDFNDIEIKVEKTGSKYIVANDVGELKMGRGQNDVEENDYRSASCMLCHSLT